MSVFKRVDVVEVGKQQNYSEKIHIEVKLLQSDGKQALILI